MLIGLIPVKYSNQDKYFLQRPAHWLWNMEVHPIELAETMVLPFRKNEVAKSKFWVFLSVLRSKINQEISM